MPTDEPDERTDDYGDGIPTSELFPENNSSDLSSSVENLPGKSSFGKAKATGLPIAGESPGCGSASVKSTMFGTMMG